MLRLTYLKCLFVMILVAVIFKNIRSWFHCTTQKQKMTSSERELCQLTSQNDVRNRSITKHVDITKIIIMATYRSGSTFLSQLFVQNPNVFYAFEPLALIQKWKNRDLIQKHGPTVLREMLNCDIGMLSYMTPGEHKWVFRYGHFNSTFEDTYQICKSRKIKVVKIISLDNLENLSSHFGNDTAILLLVRDPRGIFNSRMHLYDEHPKNITAMENRLNKMRHTCLNFVTNLKFLEKMNKLPRHEQASRPLFKQIIYEEVANNPIIKSKAIYRELNIDFDEHISEWIHNYTNYIGGLNDKEIRNPVSTKRNSRITARKWLHQLEKSQIYDLQNITECAEVIDILKYEPVF
ncbi:unnamed protein product [Owenia fusiformis]|uniref:Uncharacterized protein n=1 Tax=Owenia fusiformis TaxID=6347 RepID=A0A8J1XQZ3_OWEFU|nr:unnamed protein product [Owenia fusiformis]